MDLVNQGKVSVLDLWGTNNNNKLRKILLECHKAEEDFYNPTAEFRKSMIDKIVKENK